MIISDGYNGTPSGFENICEDESGVTKHTSSTLKPMLLRNLPEVVIIVKVQRFT